MANKEKKIGGGATYVRGKKVLLETVGFALDARKWQYIKLILNY